MEIKPHIPLQEFFPSFQIYTAIFLEKACLSKTLNNFWKNGDMTVMACCSMCTCSVTLCGDYHTSHNLWSVMHVNIIKMSCRMPYTYTPLFTF